MRNLHFTSSLLGFILLLGAIFFAQCDTDTRTDRSDQYSQEQDQVPRTNEEDRRYDGTETEGTLDQETDNFDNNRDQLVADIEELNDFLSDELSGTENITDEQAEQIENDQTELERILREVQAATENNWEDTQSETQQTFEQISSRYEQRGNTSMND